eukprot:3314132-Lingulodinium_polyedra.AAC.1
MSTHTCMPLVPVNVDVGVVDDEGEDDDGEQNKDKHGRGRGRLSLPPIRHSHTDSGMHAPSTLSLPR